MKSYSIYINNNTLVIANSIPNQFSQIQQLDSNTFNFNTFYKNLIKGNKNNYIIISETPKKTFKVIKNELKLIEAAGGLVENADGDYLFIFRNKKWDLPKGKVEKGEKVKDAAVREVEEECGVEISKRLSKLSKTYHIYELNGEIIFKKTSWYRMKVKGCPKLVPQKEEGITSATWVNSNQLAPQIKNTYPLILEVLKREKLV